MRFRDMGIRFKSLFYFGIFVFLSAQSVEAGELVYKAVNPNFGGNPFNAQALLSNAQAQNGFTPPSNRATPLEEFSNTLQRNLLSGISREITDRIIGEDAQDSGVFQVGDTNIDFNRNGGTVNVNVQDTRTGERTSIKLPVPQY